MSALSKSLCFLFFSKKTLGFYLFLPFPPYTHTHRSNMFLPATTLLVTGMAICYYIAWDDLLFFPITWSWSGRGAAKMWFRATTTSLALWFLFTHRPWHQSKGTWEMRKCIQLSSYLAAMSLMTLGWVNGAHGWEKTVHGIATLSCGINFAFYIYQKLPPHPMLKYTYLMLMVIAWCGENLVKHVHQRRIIITSLGMISPSWAAIFQWIQLVATTVCLDFATPIIQ